MSQPLDPDLLDLAVNTLQEAIRRVSARLLEAPSPLDLSHFRQVERLMRIAIALCGEGRRPPYVQVHGPRNAEVGELPEIVDVDLVSLLAVHAADHLDAALRGDPEARRALEHEAERLLEYEEIYLI